MPKILSTRLKIGMEIHVELATRTKMFTRTPSPAHPDFYDTPPNTLIDPMVVALPGAMPVMNRAAVEMSMMVGLALGCEIPDRAEWDRKNYFYPDLPKGYQISQYEQPLCVGGSLEIDGADGAPVQIRITRAHLEEDTGKLGHELPGGQRYEGSLVDYNRAGTPLLEIVTEPDVTCAEDAVTFGRELRSICRCLGVSAGIMQRGHMRFEPNINVIIETDDGSAHATPIVEIKNLNSFRAVRGAIEFEHRRQIEAWENDGRVAGPGEKTTRGWDDDRAVTVLQRAKEDAHDYRYFPEPDLVPVVVDDAWREKIRARLPELPRARRGRYEREYGLTRVDAATLTDEPAVSEFYEQAIAATVESGHASGPAAAAAGAKLLLNAGAKRANERGCLVHDLGITATQIADILRLRAADEIGSSAADALFGHLCDTDDDARTVAEREGLLQVSDTGQLDAWVEAAVEQQPQAAEDFAAGKDAAVGRLVGAVMKLSNGQADAKSVQAKLRERLRG